MQWGSDIFKVRLTEVYQQIPVDGKCAEILTISTYKGLSKFLRLPFEMKVAPVIFQLVMDTMLSRIDFAITYLDDILMESKSREHARM